MAGSNIISLSDFEMISLDKSFEEVRQTERLIYFSFVCVEFCGLVSIALVVFWLAEFAGGFAWDSSSRQFNWHPVLMIIGLLVLPGTSLVSFRVLGFVSKQWARMVHVCVHSAIVVCVSLSLYAVVNNHDEIGVPNFYSLHSWLGLATISLLLVQVWLALTVHLVPQVPDAIKEDLIPVHRVMGMVVLAISVVTIISGITEKARFMDNLEEPYSGLPAYGLVSNLLALSVVFFGLGVAFLVVNPEFDRAKSDDPSEFLDLTSD